MKVVKLIGIGKVLDVLTKVNLGTMPTLTAMGVEVELENCPTMDMGGERVLGFTMRNGTAVRLQHGINAHVDGSLRNHGIELVTPPMRGAQIDIAVKYMCDLAKQHGWVISNRAGIHVHMDVQQFEIAQLINLMQTYALVEPALFKWISDGRQDSIFCKAWTDDSITDSLSSYVQTLRALDEGGDFSLWKMRSRYTALNLESVSKYGTLEFRHMRTTLDHERILKWCRILQRMRMFAEGTTITEDMLKGYGPASMLNVVFGPELGRELYYGEFDSYYNLRSIPLCHQVFNPQVKSKPVWQGYIPKKTGIHAGYQRFTKDKIAPKPVDLGLRIPVPQVAQQFIVGNHWAFDEPEQIRNWRADVFEPVNPAVAPQAARDRIRQLIERDIMAQAQAPVDPPAVLDPPALAPDIEAAAFEAITRNAERIRIRRNRNGGR